MTTLDRAFIKAYSEVHAPAAARPHRPAQTASVQHAMLHATAERLARPRSGIVPDPLASKLGHAADPLAPLSSFAARPKIEDTFRPLLEVDSLSWPVSCVDLLARSTASWDRFAEHLSQQVVEDNKSIAIVSCRRGEGRTTIALATARHMAARGLRCVVVDADFENPTLAARCGVSPQVGWGEVIDGDLPFGEALVAAVGDSVAVMPWQGPAGRLANPSAALRATTGFRLLREHYDLVIVDAMPLAGRSAETELANLAKVIGPCGVYLIWDTRAAQAQQLMAACARLARLSMDVSGVIENFCQPAGSARTPSYEEH